jgi:hypothetical protein
MAHGYVVLLALDQLQASVAADLSARYCPHSGSAFLTRFWALFALFVAVSAMLFLVAGRRKKTVLCIVACALFLFAIGSGAWVLYGLSGCSGPAAEGLIWDSP